MWLVVAEEGRPIDLKALGERLAAAGCPSAAPSG